MMETTREHSRTTKAEVMMDAAIQAYAGDPERVEALERARRFKRSWIDLAQVLLKVRNEGSFERWGFQSFEDYCTKELHVRRGTVDKLCATYGFLAANAPRLVAAESGGDTERRPIPTWQAVDFVARAEERGAVDEGTLAEMKRAVFDEGAPAPALSRRYREVAFPVDEDQASERRREQVVSAARRLADLVAEPSCGVPRLLAQQVERVVGELVVELEGRAS